MNHTVVAPGIVKFDISKTLSQNILNELKNNSNWQSAKTIGEIKKLDTNIDNKKARNSDILPFPEIFPELDKKINFEVNQSLFFYSILYADSYCMPKSQELFSALRYNEGGYYKTHVDSDINMYRTISCIVYLNPSEYVGGETYFKYFNLNYKPENPCILLFPSNYIYAHSAMPIETGTKYVLVNWYNDLYPFDDLKTTYQNISIINKNNIFDFNNEKYFKIWTGRDKINE